MRKIDRRDFVRFATGGAAGLVASQVAVPGLSHITTAFANPEVRVPTGQESWALSVCTMCTGNCGLKVRKIGSRAVRTIGNPLHPINRGGLCPKGVAALQALYHPDRIRTPLQNVGTRTSPRWKQISWEQAVAILTGRLRALATTGRAHSVVFLDGSEKDLSSRLFRTFLYAYGSPNYLVAPSGMDAIQAAAYAQLGTRQPVAYDLTRARYVLSFGAGLLDGWGSPSHAMRAFSRWRETAAGSRTKVVQIESRLSSTAAHADEWVPIVPGTEASLALGLMYVLITEGLYDLAFVRDHTFGFEDFRDDSGKLRMGLRSLVLRDYRLQNVAAVTGIAPETILRVAREMAANRPALVLGGSQTSTLPGDPYAAIAVLSLNALLGSIEVPGGIVLREDLPDAAVQIPPPARPRLDQPSDRPLPTNPLVALPEAIRRGHPYPVEVVILNEVDPLFSLPQPENLRDSLRRVPLLVSFATFPGESSQLADLILPTPTDLERWHAATAPPGFAQTILSVSPPAVPPRHNSRHPAEVLLDIAKTVSEPVRNALPFASFEAYVRAQVDALYRAETGGVFGSDDEEIWDRLLERSGWWSPTYSSADELWQQMKDKGGWWVPNYVGPREHVFESPSKRFEFRSQLLEKWAAKGPEYAARLGSDGDPEVRFLPHQTLFRPAPDDFPLLLVPIEVLPLAGGTGAELPYLQQIAGAHVFSSWDSWLEINPSTAERLEIGNGDLIWVQSQCPGVRVKVRARLYAGARPGVVHLPIGYGQKAGSRWACRGVNPLALLVCPLDPLTGLPQVASTHVKIYKSEEA